MNTMNEPVPGQTAYRISQILSRVQVRGPWLVLALVSAAMASFFSIRHSRLPLLRNVECQQHSYFDLLNPFPHKDCGDLSWAILLTFMFFLFSFVIPLMFSTVAKVALDLSGRAGNDDANMDLGLSLRGRGAGTRTGAAGIDLNTIGSTDRASERPRALKTAIKTSIMGLFKSLWNAILRLLAAALTSLLNRRRSKAIKHFSAIPKTSKYWSSAQFELGHEKQGDRPAAITHFTQAADGGHRMAALELGLLIMEQDPDEAKRRLGWGLSTDSAIGEILFDSPELRDDATLALAWLNFNETRGNRRDHGKAKALVRPLLDIDENASVPDQPSTQWFTWEFIKTGRARVGANLIRTLIENDERAELVRQQREQARAELYSFITHSIPSAMVTVVAETEQSLEIVQGEFLASKEVRDHLIKSLSSALGRAGFIDNLMSTHKLLIAGKERLQLAWESESADYESPLLVVIDATKQALAQTLFADQEYEQIDLDRSDDDQINRIHELSLAQLTGTTTNESLAEFLRFVSSELPFLSFDCKPGIAWRVKRGGIRFSVLVSVVSELMRNALRYREHRSPLIVRIEGRGGIVSIVLMNTIAKNGTQRLGVTNRGLAFIREFAEAISELNFSSSATESTHTATLCVSDGSNK